MKNQLCPLLLIIAFSLSFSCNEDEGMNNPHDYDCVFEQNDSDMDGLIDEVERNIMTECTENALGSISEISNNLIGEWELIGHGEGWVPTISQPCGYITVTEDELTFEFRNAYIDTITTHSWEIEERVTQGGAYFILTLVPEPASGLEIISTFCTKYMYGDGTPLDGNMYLYEKVN